MKWVQPHIEKSVVWQVVIALFSDGVGVFVQHLSQDLCDWCFLGLVGFPNQKTNREFSAQAIECLVMHDKST